MKSQKNTNILARNTIASKILQLLPEYAIMA
jgi:hypothetical protein